MSDGTLSVRRKQAKSSEAAAGEFEIPLAALRAGTFDSFLGMLPNIGQGHVKSKGRSKPIGDVDEFRIEARRRKKLREYDKLLKSFKYSAALDSILRKVIDTGLLVALVRVLMIIYSKSHLRRSSRLFKSWSTGTVCDQHCRVVTTFFLNQC